MSENIVSRLRNFEWPKDLLDEAAYEIERLRAENAALRQDQRILNVLRAGGVENWEWYEDSLESILGEDTPK